MEAWERLNTGTLKRMIVERWEIGTDGTKINDQRKTEDSGIEDDDNVTL